METIPVIINVSYIDQEQLLKKRKMIDISCIDRSRLNSSVSPASSFEHYTLLLEPPVPIVFTSIPIVPSIEEQRASEVVNTCSVALSVDQNDNRYVKSSGTWKGQSLKEGKVSDASNSSRRSYHPCRRYRKGAHRLYGIILRSHVPVAPPSIDGQQTTSPAVNGNDKHIRYPVTCKAQPLKKGKVSDTILRFRRNRRTCQQYRKGTPYLCGRINESDSTKIPRQPHSRLDLTKIKEFIDERHIEMILYIVYLTSLIVDNSERYFKERREASTL